MVRFATRLLAQAMYFRLAVFAALALAIPLLTACGGSTTGGHPPTTPVTHATSTTATATAPLTPTSVIVLRYSEYPEQARVAPFQMTSDDAAKVVQLYQAAHTLPSAAQVYAGCPQQVNVVGYELTFLHGKSIVLQMMLRGGCPVAELSGVRACYVWTPAFTAQIAATLGVPATTLQPPTGLVNTASPAGPFAAEPTPPLLVGNLCL